jgi:hypothetical protein
MVVYTSAPRSGHPPAMADDAVRVQFKAVGSAPLLKKNKFKISAAESFGTVRACACERCVCTYVAHTSPAPYAGDAAVRVQVISFLRGQLKFPESASLVRVLWCAAECVRRCDHVRASCVLLQLLYCNSAFAPSPDESVRDLFEVRHRCAFASVAMRPQQPTPADSCVTAAPRQCFQVNGELVINYSTMEAWG